MPERQGFEGAYPIETVHNLFEFAKELLGDEYHMKWVS